MTAQSSPASSGPILSALDFDDLRPESEVLQFATGRLATRGQAVHIIHVVENHGPLREYLGPDFQSHMNDQITDRTKALTDWASGQTRPATIEIRYGSVYREVIAYADRIKASHIVIGSHATTFSDYLLGTNAARIMRHAPCSVTVLRRPE